MLERAGLPVITDHQGRHSAATIQLAAGISPHEVSANLGHSSMALLKIYGQILPELQASSSKKLGKLLRLGERPPAGKARRLDQ